ncbi:probable inactive receptor kinase At5g67200 [Dendrobium catenatum]|uniref:Putative inactive receptor kinase n=1 Tax=Dendrobium catenatum TaxID=906689 RepID=A0A2I0VFC7_9ASPA|nr:probable inactive receptor kinase At5g67200 [Dendrobium catenatum]PKU62121.1 putative inactive receptor kinase [Dendrobium catenatum]
MPHQMLLLYALLLIMLPPPEVPFTAALPPSPISDAFALLSFKSAADPGGSRLSFFSTGNHSTSEQCRWPGVSCFADGRVVRLVLESLGLNGTLPNSTLGRLDQLRVLSLKSNSLSGPIPDLSALLNLKALFLGNNLLSGPFPSSLVTLHRLRTLDLSHNFLSGPIPSGLTFLDRLYFLRLDSNLLSGPVPSLNQSSLKIFNVSANDLAGPVPVTAALSAFGAAAFSGNVRLCGAVVRRECGSHLPFFQFSAAAPSPAKPRQGFLLPGSASATSPHRRTHRKGVMAAGFFVCAAILLILLLGVSLAVRKKKRRGMGKNVISDVGVGDGEMEVHVESTAEEVEDRCNELVAAAAMTEEKMKRLGKSGCLVFCAGEAQVYTMEQLMRASAEMLGRGSVGSTYKAVLDNRLILCVKRLDAAKIGMAGKEGFERHMEAVGRLRHPNLVPLRAFFHAKEERLLVYDYQPNGSLHSLIHGSRSTRAKPLHWTSCLKIAEDVAQGLAYIHQASRLVHGNIRSSNVLLGSDFEACLTDNCLSFLVDPIDPENDSGYRAPETRKSNRHLTPRSDIYAFGVLLLELLTGKPPLQHHFLVATDLPTWVRSVRDDEGADDERLRMIVDVAAACVRSSPESRPTTWQVLKMIQEVKEADIGEDDDKDSGIS